jgi:ABC-type branched-subunit amino acid transport system ATPase component
MNDTIDELRRLLAAAPDRLFLLGEPWSTNTGPPVILVGSNDPHAADIILCGQDIDEWPADERGPDYTRQDRYAALAVAAVNHLPALLARLRAAEARVESSEVSLADALVREVEWGNRARAAEARVSALETEMAAASIGLVGLSAKQREYADLAQSRIAALEVAGRAVVNDRYIITTDPDGTVQCARCGEGHGDDCTLVALAALLTEATPTQAGAGEDA